MTSEETLNYHEARVNVMLKERWQTLTVETVVLRDLIADSRELRRLRASLSRLEQEWRKEAGQLEQTAVGALGLSVFRALVHKAEHLRQAADALKTVTT